MGKREVRMSNQPLAEDIKAIASVVAALDPLFGYQQKLRVLVAALTLLELEQAAEAVRSVK